MKTLLTQSVITTLLLCLVSITWAGNVTIPNTFSSGTKAVAAEVNANFGAVKAEVDDNDSRIAALEATITALQNRLAAVEGNSVLALDGYLTRDIDNYGYTRALFSGINVQVVNGVTQKSLNGLGNLIVGYNNPNPAVNDKSGSHNLVTGDEHHYSSYGGFLAGYQNTSNGMFSSVSGGGSNTASGLRSSVTGGLFNTASGAGSTVSGGTINTASGSNSTVGGGNLNTASGYTSSVSGGDSNTATGEDSSISGGHGNEARGIASTVGGGLNDLAPRDYNWIGGNWFSEN